MSTTCTFVPADLISVASELQKRHMGHQSERCHFNYPVYELCVKEYKGRMNEFVLRIPFNDAKDEIIPLKPDGVLDIDNSSSHINVILKSANDLAENSSMLKESGVPLLPTINMSRINKVILHGPPSWEGLVTASNYVLARNGTRIEVA